MLSIAFGLHFIDVMGILLLTTRQLWAEVPGALLMELGRDPFLCLGHPVVQWVLVLDVNVCKEHAKSI